MLHSDRPELKPGTRIEVSMQWRLEGEGRAVARFVAEIEALDTALDRLLCRLVALASLHTTELPAPADVELLARIKQRVGTYAYLPHEAASGMTLFLKPTTLTGELNYFFSERPDKA